MSTFYASGKRGYGAIKKETTPGVPVIPTNFFYLESEGVTSPFENETVAVAADSRAEEYFVVAGKNAAPAGQITMPIQADTFGYFLTGMFGLPTTGSVSDSSYTHAWTSNNSGNIPTYSVDLGNGDAKYARRYVGSHFGGLTANQKSNVHYAQLQLMARYSFVTATLQANLSIGATTAVLDTNYGLVVGDVFKLGFGTATQETVTLTSVNVNGVGIGFDAIASAKTAGDYCVLSNRTPSYSTATPQFPWIGGTTTSIGGTLGTVASVARFNEFTLNFNQKLEPEHAPGGTTDLSRYPVDILVSSYAASASWAWLHKDVVYLDAMRQRTRLALDITATGNLIGTSSRDTLRYQIPKLVLDPSGAPLGGADIVREQHSGRAQYSSSDSFDVKVLLTNAISTYA